MKPSSRWPKKSRRSLRARCSRVSSPVPAPKRTKPRFCWRAWPPARYDIVALRHAYSGGSSLTKSVTAQAPWRKSGIISVGIAHAINPYCYRCPLGLKYPDCEVACAKDVENLIQTGTSGSDRRVHCRADSGSRRIYHAAAGIFQDRLHRREEIWRTVYLRRSADRIRAHRKKMVWHRALGSYAGHHDLRQRHGQRHADRRDDHHERAGRVVSGTDDFHVWRKSGDIGCGEGDD